MLNVMLIEDDIDLAQTIVQYLELEDINCDHAANGMSGLELIQHENYDVIILDINLPRMDGYTVCQTLREQGNDTSVIMLTARDQLDDKLEGFEAGTDDFLVKPFEMKELIVRLHALSRRRSGQAKRLKFADLEMNVRKRIVTRAGKELHLSPTCWKLLEVLIRTAPAVISRQDLMESVWGEDLPDSNSLHVHLFNLRKAVDSPYSTTLIHTIPGHGFVLKEQKNEAKD